MADWDDDDNEDDKHDEDSEYDSEDEDDDLVDTFTRCRLPILLCLLSMAAYTLISCRAAHFVHEAASTNPGCAWESKKFERYAELLPISALTHDFPIVVVVRDLRLGTSADSLANPTGSFANFSRALEARLSPVTSCLSQTPLEFAATMLPVQRLEGYHLTSLPTEERRNMLAQDGRSAVIRVVNCRKTNIVSRVQHITEFVRDTAIPEAIEVVASGFEGWVEFGVLETTQALMQAKDVVIYEMSHTDVITFPIAMLVLMVAAGPLSLLVLVALPISLLSAFTILDFFMEYVRFSFMVPPLFATLCVALSLDYALLLLCRFNEDLGLSCGRASDASSARQACREAVHGMLHQAGYAVFASSILLAFAFATLYVTADSEEVQSIGFGGAVTVMSAVCVSLAFFPALLLLLADLAPLQLARIQLCGRRPQRNDSISRPQQPSGFYHALTTIGIKHPRLVLLATLLLALPLCWRAATLRPSIDQGALVPLNSLFSRGEQLLVGSGLPPSQVMPPILVVEATRRPTNASAVCEDRDALLSSFLSIVWPRESQPVGPISCASLGNTVCSPLSVQQQLQTSDLSPATVALQAELLRSSLCPLTCMACGSSGMPLLADDVFATLAEIQEVYGASLDTVKPGSSAHGQLLHIGKLGSDVVSAADARRYISGRATLNVADAVRALEFRANFARMTTLDGSATVMQFLHPFLCMSDDAAVWGREFIRQLQERGLLGDNASSSPLGVDLTLIMHEEALWEDMDSTYRSLLVASLAAVGCLLLLTGVLFRSIALPPRLLFTVVVTLGVACGVCGFVIDSFSLPGVYWVLPPFAIPVITGLTLDYDLYILTRVIEYRMEGRLTSEAFELGLEKSRGVISMAGVVMATAFSALCFSDLLALRQFGVLLVTATLCDTFLIRPFVVPACAFAFWSPEANWWPRSMPPVQDVS